MSLMVRKLVATGKNSPELAKAGGWLFYLLLGSPDSMSVEREAWSVCIPFAFAPSLRAKRKGIAVV
ncbi:hypothetical protein L0337_26050 [candidate division KSB1 bacterium]|nr:hypothetical protein [candidate division KSB1 bacterium]